ncbi:extracellular solute-binding protein [Alkalihalobacillus hemicellulosilyticus]|uniref:ABC transporter n=1 Tax=Halalkalibacter hemicellulosilyticusJCM 9152 TaxID=1236971 RepID=W4QKU8_9BACI|nr:extracellular solute-binding protein [Halalkalibacter hemicellulosilyticus]GAE32522.1 ABC transporter [Halalkalibacter hemicellulosilyticusJCM 9152]
MKKCWLMLGAMLFTLVVVVGCSGDVTQDDMDDTSIDDEGETTDENALYELGDEHLEISVFGHYDWYTMTTWGEDSATEWIQENKNVTLKSVDHGGNAAQSLSTMIAGNDLPDVIWLDRGADVERLREGGVLVPFDDYLDKYTNLRDWFGEEGINMLRSEDGKLYQFPNWYNSEPFGNAGYVVNKGIYDTLGSPPLETPDDLYNYLKLVREEFPDVTPFETHVDGQGVNILYSAFAEAQSPANINNQAVPVGDEMTSIFTNEEYIESMKFASKLFRERLMTQDALTQDLDMVTEKVASGRVAVYAAASPTDLARQGHYHLIEDDPDSGYFMIWPIAKEGYDRNEIYPGSYNQMGWNVSVITTSAANPEAVFAFWDWLTGPEGQAVTYFGPEGLYWDGWDDEELPQFTDLYFEDPQGLEEIEQGSASFHFNGNSNFLDTAKAKFEATLPEEQRNWTTHWQYTITWDTQYDATQFLNINPLPESSEGRAQQRIGEIFEEARARALYAESDEEVEAIFAQAEEDAQSVGYSDVLAYQTTKWQENLATMSGE